MEESQSSPPSCTTCHKLQADLPQPLKRCAKCQTTTYCSRDCQKQDWKLHKRVCASQAASHDGEPTPSTSTSTGGRHNPGFHAINSMMGLSSDDFLHKLPERGALTQLIDCFRMRAEDEYNFAGNTLGCYDG
ncbi:uncharacterized protein LY89DRAFT_400203 [Mollisia scopiformis]|uniref:MYND-type domain-containing protein n=1 Tax=Mollisia scopiformis TaxID=149040 RepID=A0A132B3C0_MOLSC|nr:uncharacterized protein LY89DRAFT_400203 [Mollisia scopiformis]KUJ06892.1 hypothetical protein LY89DRAFT_400203 [Mollisia scopiformis]